MISIYVLLQLDPLDFDWCICPQEGKIDWTNSMDLFEMRHELKSNKLNLQNSENTCKYYLQLHHISQGRLKRCIVHYAEMACIIGDSML